MRKNTRKFLAVPLSLAAFLTVVGCASSAGDGKPNLSAVRNIVVIYAENRSFDNLYGHFPGANGLQNLPAQQARQLDRDGTVLPTLPPIWNGLTQRGVTPAVTQAMTTALPNAPFAIDDPDGFNTSRQVATRDLWHRFYENQMQIDGGKNDKFAAWADSGGLTMGHYAADTSTLPLWHVAQRYTLADNFFMSAFGGSFLNHQWLACACTPVYPHADQSPAAGLVSAVEPDGVTLKVAANSPRSALAGPPKFVNSSNLTPDFYAVNTMQPPYQPSGNASAAQGDPRLADPSNPTTLPPQTQRHIGDALDDAHVSWAWYSGAWDAALAAMNRKAVIYGPERSAPNFQPHHQPFNYFADLAPGTEKRAQHLLDGGVDGKKFIEAIDAGKLPQVAFYKPQGNLNEHPGYTDVESGDRHIAEVINHLERSPQWPHMVVVVAYDENGGFWDHVAPPKGDRFGPGTRIPALIVSPFAKKGYVDHTQYDTTSILRFITHRFELETLPGLKTRNDGLIAHGNTPMGDLTNALDLSADQ
ncbi:acid phosphatase [Trinickia sp. LjRoot230]|uniref:acid phosphatase n=1 Tax=Trinickia sp. LjRoot230 TaxID=3342288 RepID=UPI003ED0E479